MKKMVIYEPAMCCPTGICGASVDKELLRVLSLVNQVNQTENRIERCNLTDQPMAFVENQVVNDLLNSEGLAVLPLTFFEGQLFKKGAYPTNDEVSSAFDMPIKKAVRDRSKPKLKRGTLKVK